MTMYSLLALGYWTLVLLPYFLVQWCRLQQARASKEKLRLEKRITLALINTSQESLHFINLLQRPRGRDRQGLQIVSLGTVGHKKIIQALRLPGGLSCREIVLRSLGCNYSTLLNPLYYYYYYAACKMRQKLFPVVESGADYTRVEPVGGPLTLSRATQLYLSLLPPGGQVIVELYIS